MATPGPSGAEQPPVLQESSNVLSSPPGSLKVTRRSRSRRSHRARSAASPRGEAPEWSRLAAQLHAHVDRADALRTSCAELHRAACAGSLDAEVVRARLEALCARAAQHHEELHAEWRIAVLCGVGPDSPKPGAGLFAASPAASASPLDAVAELGDAQPQPQPQPRAPQPAREPPPPPPRPPPPPAAAAPAAAAEEEPGGFARPPPVSLPSPARALLPPHGPSPAVRSAPAGGAACAAEAAARAAAAGCGARCGGSLPGGSVTLPLSARSSAGVVVGAPSPFVRPATISATSISAARLAFAGRPLPASARGASLRAARASTPAAAGGGEAAPWGKAHAAATFVQARARGVAARRAWRGPIKRGLTRRCVAAELVSSERRYCDALGQCVRALVRPLEALPALGERGARALVGNVRVIHNVSALVLAAVGPALRALCPARALGCSLVGALPLLKVYAPHVSSYARTRAALAKARESGAVERVVREAEAALGCPLETVLIQPVQRVPRYLLLVERLLGLTPPGAPEAAPLQEAALRLKELCTAVNAAIADAEAAARVAALAAELGADERCAALPGGLALAHRRFVREGLVREIPPPGGGSPAASALGGGACGGGGVERGRGARPVRLLRLLMFNDVLLLATPSLLGGHAVREALSLAKARVRALPEPEAPAGGARGGAAAAAPAAPLHAFEVVVGRRCAAFACGSLDEKHGWVKALRKQVAALLEAFKKRGRSLAFLPQNVAMLRSQLHAAEAERSDVEGAVCAISEQLRELEQQVADERAARDAAEAEVGGTAEASSERLAALLQAVFEADLRISRAEQQKVLLQSQLGVHVARLSQISEMLEHTSAKHDGDSLLQFMLFSSSQ